MHGQRLTHWQSLQHIMNFPNLVAITHTTLTKTDCPTIPISSGLSRFCSENLKSQPICDQDMKNPDFDSCCMIFLSNSHKRKRNVCTEYLTLEPWTEKFVMKKSHKNWDQITKDFWQKWHFRASRFKNFLGGHASRPP